MSTGSNRERVLAVLRVSSVPLDDDQLSARAGVQPRQTVNMVCRRLEREGVLKRYVGVDGKIVNELAALATNAAPGDEQHVDDPVVRNAPGAAAVTSQLKHPAPPGNSDEQRAAERVMLDLLGADLGMVLNPTRIPVPSGEWVEVDGADTDRTVVVECWAHQGAPKSAQRNKVLSDAFKLSWIGAVLYPRPRRILCLSDPAAAAPFLPAARTWAARALHDLSIDVIVVTLPDTVRDSILNAQRRQYR
jgi:hypothetical protein